MFNGSITLMPAYGRDYRSKADALKDWADGKDFKVAPSGQYASIRDLSGREVWIRYDKLRKIIKAQA